MRMYSASGRSRWPLVIVGVIVLVAIAGFAAYGVGRSQNTAAATPTATPTTPPPTVDAGVDGDTGVAPTGCLGGASRNVAMVLSAQQQAGHDTYGAVEVATAFYRWFFQYPHPTEADVKAVRPIFSGADSEELASTVKAAYASGGTPEGIAKKTPYYFSTTTGEWYVDSERSTPGRIIVDVSGQYVIDGAVSPSRALTSAFVMKWEDGSWHVSDQVAAASTKVLANGSTQYTNGC